MTEKKREREREREREKKRKDGRHNLTLSGRLRFKLSAKRLQIIRKLSAERRRQTDRQTLHTLNTLQTRDWMRGRVINETASRRRRRPHHLIDALHCKKRKHTHTHTALNYPQKGFKLSAETRRKAQTDRRFTHFKRVTEREDVSLTRRLHVVMEDHIIS